jgi:hypothetical protein
MGGLLEQLHYDAMDAWRARYSKSTTLADLLAGPLTCIEDTVTTWPGGRLIITCTLHSRRRDETETYFLRAQRKGPETYRITHSSLKLK